MPSIIKKTLYGKYGPCFEQGRSRTVDHILLHHTASGGSGGHGGSDAVWSYWYGVAPGNRTSANYLVGKDGSIIEAVPPGSTAWHAGSSEWNARSIGIEIVNLGNGKDPFPDVQMKSLAWLVKYLLGKFPAIGIKPLSVVDGHQRLGDVWEHAAVCDGKIDMRSNFPWQRLYGLVTAPELTGAVVKVPVPVKKPAWWAKMRAYLKRVKG